MAPAEKYLCDSAGKAVGGINSNKVQILETFGADDEKYKSKMVLREGGARDAGRQ